MQRIIEHVKDDWLYMLPYRVSHSSYRGINRQAYALICFLYYSVKSVFILFWVLMFYLYKYVFFVYKFIFWDIWKKIFKFEEREWYRKVFRTDTYEEEEEEPDEELEDKYEESDDEEELPVQEDDLDEIRFSQLFRVGADMCLLVHHVEMCPDETAYIQVVDEEGYTPLYKRKVRRDKQGNRFIVFNSTNYYLDDTKTQPTIKKK